MSYHISDHHFNHANIIKYCERPFENVLEMQEYMIEKWNSVIGKDDLVYHHGDFALGVDKEEITEVMKRLNGRKILIYGNHDRKGVQWFKDIGFIEVYKKAIVVDNKILSHRPHDIETIPEGYINIHGHVHNHRDKNRVYTNEGILKSINVSVEVLDYMPLWVD